MAHASLNKEMEQSSRQAHLLEKATEAPWQFIILLTAVLSGLHRNKKWEIEFFTGQVYSVPYGMCSIIGAFLLLNYQKKNIVTLDLQNKISSIL